MFIVLKQKFNFIIKTRRKNVYPSLYENKIISNITCNIHR